MARLTLRLPEDLHRRLRLAAERTDSSLNDLIVAAITGALARGELHSQDEDELPAQVQHIRRALGALVVELEPRYGALPFGRNEEIPDSDTPRRITPVLLPPLSATISAEREERF